MCNHCNNRLRYAVMYLVLHSYKQQLFCIFLGMVLILGLVILGGIIPQVLLGVNTFVIGRCFPITNSVSFSIGFWPSPCNLFILFYSLLMLFGVISGWVCISANIVGMYRSFIHPTLTFVFFFKNVDLVSSVHMHHSQKIKKIIIIILQYNI